jgi:anti-anti-sigma regulatory factor
VVFSLFSRKDKGDARRGRGTAESAVGPARAVAPAAPDTMAARREAARLTEEKINRIESEMIAPAPARQASPAPAGAAPPAEPDLTVAAPPMRAANGHAESKTSPGFGDLSDVMAIDINASSSLPGALEEAAILFANGQPAAAAAALQHALTDADLGGFQQLTWLMLLDLHQLTGDRAAFESLALDYAARFESSPPAWVEAEGQSTIAVRQAVGSVVALPARLDASLVGRIDLLERGLERRRETIVDCGSVQAADLDGAARLVALFRRFEKAPDGQVLIVRGAQRLFDASRAALEPGRRDRIDACWMLALYALRLLGDEQAFEDLGIEYCVTFEVSPPSWEALPPSLRSAASEDARGAQDARPTQGLPPAEPNAFVMAGDVTGRMQNEIRALRAFATGRSDVVVDCRPLRRLEFVAVGELLNEVVNLRSAGKQVLFAEPNRLVYALMLVMGIPEIAEIRKRRI